MRLVITQQAEKDLSRLDKNTRGRIRAALDKMIMDIRSVDLKKLEGNKKKNLWRLRVGDYRVILRIEGEEITAYALRVKNRREAY